MEHTGYYTWIETIIEYRDPYGMIHELIIVDPECECHYRIESPCYDHIDFINPPVDALTQEKNRYGMNFLLDHGKWTCEPAEKTHIVELCTNRKIPIEGLINVHKHKNGYRFWRL